jgi:hypothetical protein
MRDWVRVKAECFYCDRKEEVQATSYKTGVITIRQRGWVFTKVRGWICPNHNNKKKVEKSLGNNAEVIRKNRGIK